MISPRCNGFADSSQDVRMGCWCLHTPRRPRCAVNADSPPRRAATSVDAAMFRRALRIATITAVAAGWAAGAVRGDARDLDRVRQAISYLDERQEAWSRFPKCAAGRGGQRYVLRELPYRNQLRPGTPRAGAVRRGDGAGAPVERMIAAMAFRAEQWAELDSPRFRLIYDGNDRKKAESRGTEAVFNAMILARDDAARGRASAGAATRRAFLHLWATQAREGRKAGSWDWINFGLEPWEADGSRMFGAALAAIAVGSAPGYLDRPPDEAASRVITLHRDYLRLRFPEESLYNRLWVLEASTTLPGLLSADQSREVVDQVFAVQGDDGGWRWPPSGASSASTARPRRGIRTAMRPPWCSMRCSALVARYSPRGGPGPCLAPVPPAGGRRLAGPLGEQGARPSELRGQADVGRRHRDGRPGAHRGRVRPHRRLSRPCRQARPACRDSSAAADIRHRARDELGAEYRHRADPAEPREASRRAWTGTASGRPCRTARGRRQTVPTVGACPAARGWPTPRRSRPRRTRGHSARAPEHLASGSGRQAGCRR